MENDKAQFKKEFEQRLITLSVQGVTMGDSLKNKRHYTLANQFVRAITSIGANVHEAKSAHSNKDYIKFFEIALKSANETEYWLDVIKQATDINDTQKVKDKVVQVSKILATSVLTLKNKT